LSPFSASIERHTRVDSSLSPASKFEPGASIRSPDTTFCMVEARASSEAEAAIEAIRRAGLIEERYAGSAWGPVPVFGRMMSDARKWNGLMPAALAVADAYPGLMEQWAGAVGGERIDQWMPAFVKGVPDEPARERFRALWKQFGVKGPPQP
jgi:hypothetical protein